MNKEQIIEKMKERGYTRMMESRNSKDETVSITFMNETLSIVNGNLSGPLYSVEVWVEDGEFQFMYSIRTSINKLVSPRCGSFMNDEHFARLAVKFEKEVKVLYEHFG